MDTSDTSPARLRLIVGSDIAGIEYRRAISDDLRTHPRVRSVDDYGVDDEHAHDTHYPAIAELVAEAVAADRADRGVLICGTGIGVAIAANKVPGIRATVAHDSYSVERSILSNDCQILTLGQRVVGLELARRLVAEWLTYDFDPTSASFEKVSLITEYERRRSP